MKVWQLSCVVGATTAVTVTAICQIAAMRPPAPPRPSAIVAAAFSAVPLNTTTVLAKFSAPPSHPVVKAKFAPVSPRAFVLAAFKVVSPDALSAASARIALVHNQALAQDQGLPDDQGHDQVLAYAEDTTGSIPPVREDSSLRKERSALPADSDATAKRELPYLEYYVYSEVPPPLKPARVVLAALKNIPIGTPTEEIKRASDAFGLDYNFMKAVAKIESDFDARERTGSYIGLFQLSRSEFAKYGSGDITNPRDNAVAAAYKFITEAALFQAATHKTPTFSDLYLIHQQGWEAAAQHVSHPDRIAWKSMCATDEGMEKGEGWCKRAIWGNTLPSVKKEWKSVDRLTSGAFVAMWADRLDTLYARYAAADAGEATQ